MDTRGSHNMVSATKSNAEKLDLILAPASKQDCGVQRPGHLGARTLKEGERWGYQGNTGGKWFSGGGVRKRSRETNVP